MNRCKRNNIAESKWLTRVQFTLCYSILLVCQGLAQSPLEWVYDVANGLPHQEITNVFVDKSGRLWLLNQGGEYASQFDGANWTHFHLAELGLPTSPEDTFEGPSGIWLVKTVDTHPVLIRFDSLGMWHVYPKIKDKHLLYPFRYQDMILVDSDFNIFEYSPNLDSFIQTRVQLQVPYDSLYPIQTNFSFIDTNRIRVLSFSSDYMHGKECIFHIHSGKLEEEYFLDERSIRLDFREHNFISEGNKLYAHQGKKKTQVNPTNTEYINNIRRISSESIEGIILRHLDKSGTFSIWDYSKKGAPSLIIDNLNKSTFFHLAKDKSGNWWYGTGSGLFLRRKGLFFVSENVDNMVVSLHTIVEDKEGKIWFGGYNGSGFVYLKDGKLFRPKSKELSTGKILTGAFKDKEGRVFFFDDNKAGLHYFTNENESNTIELPPFNTSGYYIRPLKNGNIAAGLCNAGLVILNVINDQERGFTWVNKQKGLALDNVLTFSEDLASRIWMGRLSQGLAVYDPKRDTVINWLRSATLQNSFGLISSFVDSNGQLWMGTNMGLFVLPEAHHFDYLHQSIFDAVTKVPLPGNDVSTVYSLDYTEQYIIIGTEKAVHLLDKSYVREAHSNYRIFSLWYGKDILGKSTEQNAILVAQNGNIWVGTQEGALCIKPKELSFDTMATQLNIQKCLVGDEEIDIECHSWSLPKGKRNIKVAWRASGNLHLSDCLLYHIFCIKDKKDTLFQSLNQRTTAIEIPYAPPGDYQIQIIAVKNNLISGRLDQSFSVPKILTEQGWFWFLLTLTLAAIPFLIYRSNQRAQKRKLEYDLSLEVSKREKDHLKVQALSGFFNPHFINNSLNIIQSKYRNDPETTVVLGRLSDNVDILFKNTSSENSVHTLEYEMQLVRNYLAIAQVRFGNRFDLRIPDAEALNALQEDYKMPVLMLQIFVENAIEKGIKSLEKGGRIEINMVESEYGLQITISDNGVGRKGDPYQVATLRKTSTQVMEELLVVLNNYNEEALTIHYNDFYLHADQFINETHGTKVLIFIPKNYNYELS